MTHWVPLQAAGSASSSSSTICFPFTSSPVPPIEPRPPDWSWSPPDVVVPPPLPPWPPPPVPLEVVVDEPVVFELVDAEVDELELVPPPEPVGPTPEDVSSLQPLMRQMIASDATTRGEAICACTASRSMSPTFARRTTRREPW